MQKGLLIFVEGETEKVFYEKLIEYYKQTTSKTPIKHIIIRNVKGVSKYNSKAPNIFKNEIRVKYPSIKFTVICTYDTDVFEYAPKPPVNWSKVGKELKEYGADKIIHIKAVKMIEDWFLLDIRGLCNYLRIDEIPSLPGKTGYEKIKNLFNKKNKVYLKGYYCDKFLDYLNLELISRKLDNQLLPLKNVLFE